MRRSVCGYGNGQQQQPDMNMNYHRTHSEHVTKFAGNPCHIAGAGAVQHHTAVHKESFNEVDGTDCYDPRRGHHQQQLQAHRHHGYNNNNHGHGGRHSGGGSHRYETYEESCEEETYSAGRHHGHGHGHGGGGRRYEYETYEETSYEEEEEVVGGGGYAQLKRGHRCA
ncbi:unnamed protein product [Urochloa humidicola]